MERFKCLLKDNKISKGWQYFKDEFCPLKMTPCMFPFYLGEVGHGWDDGPAAAADWGVKFAAWLYEGMVPSRNTTARMTCLTCSSGQLPNKILCGRPLPLGLRSAEKISTVIEIFQMVKVRSHLFVSFDIFPKRAGKFKKTCLLTNLSLGAIIYASPCNPIAMTTNKFIKQG